MNKRHTNNHISLRFRRWSRASYAVFVSMTCAVTIGVLAVSVCEKSELKTNSTSILNNESAFSIAEDDDSKSSNELLTVQEIAIISVNQNDDAAARGRIKYIINQNG